MRVTPPVSEEISIQVIAMGCCCFGILRGIECGIRHGHDGVCFREEFREERGEFPHQCGLLRGEVCLSPQVIAQVEKQVAVRVLFAAVENAG